jgi:hypothetical protein
MSALRLLFCLHVSALLGACGGPQAIVPQRSTLAEVHAHMGRPTDIRFDREGNELWEYATGPNGDETWLVRARRDGRVIDVTQLLTPERFARIERLSSSKEQVRDLMGRPSEEQYFGEEAVWSWRMHISPQRGYFAVRFNREGVAIETLTLMDASGDQRDRGDRGGR